MRGFIFGIVTMLLIFVLGLFFVLMGFVNMRGHPLARTETTLAGHAVDESVERAAPKIPSPLSVDDANLAAGARLYRDPRTLCHGDLAHPKSPLTDSLNPPAPKFTTEMADMQENQNFYILEHGIRWTATPAWKNVLSDQQIWQLVTFLSHMQDLPPGAQHVFAEPGRI